MTGPDAGALPILLVTGAVTLLDSGLENAMEQLVIGAHGSSFNTRSAHAGGPTSKNIFVTLLTLACDGLKLSWFDVG